jgi:predicted ArsR family transcriptional regulator
MHTPKGTEGMSTTRTRVLELARAGRTPVQIASELVISTQAVYVHLRKLIAAGFLPARKA